MRALPWRARRYKRDWLRGRESLPPSPAQALIANCALLATAAALGVAVDWLARALP